MYSRRTRRRASCLWLLPVGLIFVVLVLLSSLFTAHTALAASPHVDMMVLNSDIGPVSTRFLQKAINAAESDKAQALVIEIDTPGGDIDSMKTMTQAELASTVPIITYVSPTGGRAASAGAFIALAAPIVAMAPTTRIGASSPVTSTGGDIDKTLLTKIENDLVAQITGFQTHFQRNPAPAALMVTKAASYDDATALSQKIVNYGAATLNDLLNTVNGQAVTLYSGHVVTLQTSGVAVNTINEDAFDGFYNVLLDPNVSFLLFIVAVIGIFLEISHPGMILPGVAGGISLVLFLLSAGSLSPNWTGLILMVLAFVLLVLDVRLATHGILTVGAMISLVVGSLLFFNSGVPGTTPQVNPVIVYIMAGVIGLMGFTLVSIVVRTRRHRVPSGTESMIGVKATALTALVPDGRVNYVGENWSATLVPPSTSVDEGSEVEIVSVDGLRLYVRPIVHALSAPTFNEIG